MNQARAMEKDSVHLANMLHHAGKYQRNQKGDDAAADEFFELSFKTNHDVEGEAKALNSLQKIDKSIYNDSVNLMEDCSNFEGVSKSLVNLGISWPVWGCKCLLHGNKNTALTCRCPLQVLSALSTLDAGSGKREGHCH